MDYDARLERLLPDLKRPVAVVQHMETVGEKVRLVVRCGEYVVDREHVIVYSFDGQTREDAIQQLTTAEVEFVRRVEADVTVDRSDYRVTFDMPDADHPLSVRADRDSLRSKLTTATDRERALHEEISRRNDIIDELRKQPAREINASFLAELLDDEDDQRSAA